MKFKLYIELATRVEDERVFNLFRFPGDTAFLPGASWSGNWWSQGTKRMQSKNREGIISRIAHDGFNELELFCRTGPTKPARAPRFAEAWIYAALSPTNILWAPVPEQDLKSIPEDRKRQNFAMKAEGVVPGSYPLPTDEKPRPTEVQYLFEVEASGEIRDHMDVQRLCIDLIRSSVPPGLKDCDAFGYGCIGGECRNMGMIRGAGARGASIDELGEKFENVYPILIGPKASCEGLAEALGTVEKWPLFDQDPSPTYILSIPPERAVSPSPRKPDVLAPSASDPAVRRWLV